MGNVISLNTFLRILREIKKKNNNIRKLFWQNFLNLFISFVGGFLLFRMLAEHALFNVQFLKSHKDLMHVISLVYAIIKFLQLIDKSILLLFMRFVKVFSSDIQIHMEERDLAKLIKIQIIDLVFEAISLLSLSSMVYPIINDNEDHIEITRKDKLAQLIWAIAVMSSLFSLLYGCYLTRSMSQFSKYSEWNFQGDQEKLNQILDNPCFATFWLSSIRTNTGIVDRDLRGFELDQLFHYLGPEHLKQLESELEDKEFGEQLEL